MTRLRSFGASAAHARLRLLLVVALGLLAARPAAAQTEIVEYYGHDALGSIRIVFTASGVATARADYEPFGEAVTIAGMPAGPLPAQQFTGQERDALERQDYFGARYYRPRHGRFSQVDPVYAGLFDPQQWNRYAYARNNPLSFVDPDGLAARENTDTSCAAMTAINKGDTPCYWAGAAAPGLSPQAQAFLNGADNFNQFAGQASQELRQGPTKQAGGRGGVKSPEEAGEADGNVTTDDWLSALVGSVGSIAKLSVAVSPTLAKKLLTLTSRNFRKNLIRTGGRILEGADAHHLLSQAPDLVTEFSRRGLNVHHPDFGAWWMRPEHQQWATAWNNDWRAYFRLNPHATSDDVRQQMVVMTNGYRNRGLLRR